MTKREKSKIKAAAKASSPTTSLSRRDLIRAGCALPAVGLLETVSRPLRASAPPTPTADVYASIGVRPIINCDHVKSVLGGSLVLPEVMRAMESASHSFVQLDELMDAVSARLAALVGSEACIVTSGCAGAIAHGTAACIAGGDPEKLRRLPNLAGLKSEVIIPRYSRNLYDQAVRMVGVKVIEVDTPEALAAACSERTAMIYMLGINDLGVSWLGDKIPAQFATLNVKAVVDIARPKNIPVFVDAAAEGLTKPDTYLQRGVTLVGYSGGKVIRGPQCCGLLMGRADLVKAAWINSAPHHSYGRPMKVGKEEIIGMMVAAEQWFERDHDAEWKEWQSWMQFVQKRVSTVAGITTEMDEGPGMTLNCPTLVVRWDGSKIGISGAEVKKVLEQGSPRIFLGEGTGDKTDPTNSSVTVRSLNMVSGQEREVAEELTAVLASPPKSTPANRSDVSPAIAGLWDVHIDYVCGSADHSFSLQQSGTQLTGEHKGEILQGELHGWARGNDMYLRSAQHYEGNWLRYQFSGTVDLPRMKGTVDLGEYGQARWTAEKRG
jgi:D-glucosaminate-6-phosphate ammonia-lyase